VREALLGGEPLGRVERERLCEKVARLLRRGREQLGEAAALLERQRAQVVARAARVDAVEPVRERRR